MATASKDNSSGADSDAASAPAAQAYTSHAAKRPGARRYNTTDSLASDNTSNLSSQLAQQHHAQHHHRAKHAKHVGGGITARIPMHARNPSAKALHKHTSASTTKLASKQHRHQSPSPDRSAQAAAATSSTAAAPAAHRRSTSDVKLPSRDSSAVNLRKNASHSSLVGKRNRSHVEIAKKSKSAANIKRSTSQRDVNKARGPHGSKSSVHFALGDNDGDDDDEDDDEVEEVEGDEWVDASGSASPYLSRRGSVASGVQSPGKAAATPDDPSHSAPSSRPHTPKEPSQLQKQQYQPEEEEEEDDDDEEDEEDEDEDEEEKNKEDGGEKEDQKQHSQQQQPRKGPAQPESSNDSASDRETIQHKEYLTSRLLKRTPSYSAPHTSKETAVVQPRSSPDSVRASLYGTPKNSTAIVGSDQTGGVTSRFVNGPGEAAEPGSFYTPIRSPAKRRSVDIQRPQSSGNLGEKHRQSIDPATAALAAATAIAPASGAEDDSALAPRAKRPARGGAPAETSRTQQKLNLQRASSTMEPSQPVVGSGGVVGGSGSLVGVSSHEGKDPRISRQLERTGMEYLVVRRYQNPIARSIARLSHLPGAAKTQQILRQPKSNGGGGGVGHAKKPSYGMGQNIAADSQQQQQQQKSRPTTPGAAAAASASGGRPRPTSIKTNGANASHGDTNSNNNGNNSNNNDNNDDDATARYCGDGGGNDAALAAILRNLWDKNMDLSASQD